ncbi:hypothetical protein [Pseudomonas sp. LB3P38]|uniref:hypothetical protein n=1 Tax=Pseudomonas lyxosi TaxID=3398358 RepID=UPI0039EE6108
MTSSQSPSSELSSIGILADPLVVNGVDKNDPDGHVPLELLLKGTLIIIPLWADPGINDQLVVTWLQGNFQTIIFDDVLRARINDPYIEVPLSPQQMSMDGIAFVQYRVWKRGGGNSDDSPLRKLTIDHTPLLVMKEPKFPHATLWGYLNNNTVPPLTQGVIVFVPPGRNIALVDDVNEVHWTGYSSLNGSGNPVQGTEGVWSKQLNSNDIERGYSQTIPFEKYVRPLIDNDSAVVVCRLFRGSRLIAESKKGLVKIDRVTPGENGPYGLGVSSFGIQGVSKMKYEMLPPILRLMSARSGVLSVDASVDKLADDSIPVSVLDSGTIIFKANNFADPQDGDEIDVHFKVVGGTDTVAGTFRLGAAAGRQYPVELEVDASLFPEQPTPAAPTRYEVRYELFKGGGGNADDSNVIEFVIDRTAPFEVKTPARRKNKPTPAVTISNPPAAPGRIVDEAWMTANPKLLCIVPVAYPLRRLDDELRYFLSSGTTVVEVFKGAIPTTGAFEVDTAELRKLPNLTRVSHSYEWQDLPGNLSLRSDAAPVFDLRLAQDPVLLPPQVPKTDPDQSIPLYLDDFVAGAPPVLAVVRQPLHGIATDEITLIVEDAADPTVFVEFGPLPLGTADLNFTLDYAKLATLFATATDPKEVKIWYEHVRAGKIVDAPGIFIYLDFVHAGPTNPDLPDLINPDLDLVTVTGASNTDNTILPGDRDKPGKIKVPAWFGLPAIVGGEHIEFYIDGKIAGEFKPFGGETEFEAGVEAAFLEALPTGTVEAYWTIKFAGSDKNIIKSRLQSVVVNARKIPLKDPTIRVRSRDEIACYAMDNATTNWTLAVTIPKDPVNLPTGKNITVYFAGVTDITGATEVPGTRDSQPYTIKAAGTPDIAQVGTAAKFKLNQPVQGAVAFGKYWYETDIGGVQTSDPVVKSFDIINTSFDYCDRLPAPPAP